MLVFKTIKNPLAVQIIFCLYPKKKKCIYSYCCHCCLFFCCYSGVISIVAVNIFFYWRKKNRKQLFIMATCLVVSIFYFIKFSIVIKFYAFWDGLCEKKCNIWLVESDEVIGLKRSTLSKRKKKNYQNGYQIDDFNFIRNTRKKHTHIQQKTERNTKQ